MTESESQGLALDTLPHLVTCVGFISIFHNCSSAAKLQHYHHQQSNIMCYTQAIMIDDVTQAGL